MGRTRYRVEDNTPAGMAKRKAKAALPVALLGLGAYAAWQKRDQLGDWLQQLKSKAGGQQGQSTGRNDSGSGCADATPSDYDPSRPSVFNSTAMAGPRDGTAGATSGLDGGTMGTDLGTQGEGAL